MANLFFFLTPFSYLDVAGFRFILLQVFLGIMAFSYEVVKKPVINFRPSFSALIALMFLSAAYAVVSGYYKDLFSTLVFSVLFFLSFSLVRRGSLPVGKIKNIYVVTCIFVSLGLIAQFFSHRFLGVELFRHIQFGGSRNAYSFIWSDFSFISLFVVSCLPMLFRYKSKVLIAIAFFIVLFASVITSARSGIAAVFLFFMMLLCWHFLISLVSGRMLLRYLALTLSVLVLPFAVLYFLPLVTGRELTFSSSGRLDGFYAGFEYLSTRPFFGALLDKDFYGDVVATVPHNFFLFPLLMGGVVYFIVFMAFILSLAWDVRHADSDLLGALLICIFGFQFIPSFFSAYFVAILLGIVMASSTMNRNSCAMN